MGKALAVIAKLLLNLAMGRFSETPTFPTSNYFPINMRVLCVYITYIMLVNNPGDVQPPSEF